MNILTIPRMILTPKDSWLHLEKAQPSLPGVFSTLVLPLSVLPPLLLYYGGTHYGALFVAGFGGKPWGMIAALFFLTEVLTFLGMRWLIGQVTTMHKMQVSTRDTWLLAGIAPTPLWLSSLALLVPSPAFNATVMLMALAASCILIYQGIHVLCHTREEIIAATITQTVMGAVLAAWALLLGIVVAL